MRQIVVISGKGGTGKTVITASFAAIAENKVMADCDVDAADLHLLLAPEVKRKDNFVSGKTPVIDKKICTGCGKCAEICRFGAVTGDLYIDTVACEGCGFCSRICPAGAIEMKDNLTGEWYVSETRFGTMVHAKLGIAQENSGKLVSLVRKYAKAEAEKQGADTVIIDGSPGIGCPVIASISGVDVALIVTEPTMSGLHDADRVIRTVRHFGVPVKMIINKYDLNRDMEAEISDYCVKEKIEIAGKIPFDRNIVKAMVEGKTIMEMGETETANIIRKAWDAL
jgi:MinD superfamily P-loop ATPase